MELFEGIEPDFVFENEKGFLVQLVHGGFSQVNVLFSKKGTQRGNHYHKISREAFYVAVGSLEITLKKGDMVQRKRFGRGDFFLIPTGVRHIMDFLEDCILIALYDIPIETDDGIKDIYMEDM